MNQPTFAYAHRADPLLAPLRSAARWPTAIVLLVVGLVHIPVTPEHLEEAPYIGVLFIALTVVCFVLAPLLVLADSRPIWLVSGLVNALAVLAYALSRTTALPQIGDDVGNWAEPLGMAAVLAEIVIVVLAVCVLCGTVPRAGALWAVVAVTVLFSAGCSVVSPAGHGEGTGMHTMADGSSMTDAAMHAAPRPSAAARMICSDETRDAVMRTFALSDAPGAVTDWSDQLYSCTYRLPAGELRLSVQDATNAGTGRAYYDGLRVRLPGATDIGGLQSFGFPALETPNGNVVFLKDGKTLRVDASGLPATALPSGFTAQEAAYGVAAAVIACWTE
jgi:hypothetical protein